MKENISGTGATIAAGLLLALHGGQLQDVVETRPTDSQGMRPTGEVLFRDDLKDLRNWHHEGAGRVHIEKPGVLRIECTGSAQGGAGAQVFCRRDFPDSIAIQFDLKVLTSNGLIITFVAVKGLSGQDAITALPARAGLFEEYTGSNGSLRSYHVSVSRYDDNGRHTGVSNWRRNPGLHLMAQGPDLCKEIQRWYHVRIIKAGPRCRLEVDGQLAHEFTDPREMETPMPDAGKVGFRAIGSNVQALIKNFRVTALK